MAGVGVATDSGTIGTLLELVGVGVVLGLVLVLLVNVADSGRERACKLTSPVPTSNMTLVRTSSAGLGAVSSLARLDLPTGPVFR